MSSRDAKPTEPCPAPWWTNCGEIARLLRHLDETMCLNVEDCWRIVEKPWNWETEYQEMCDLHDQIAREETLGENRASNDADILTDCE